MKKVYTYLFLTAFLLGVAAKSADAQVVAVGHASAEVVESVSASSAAVTFLSLGVQSYNENSEIKSPGNTHTSALNIRNYDNLNLGNFKIRSAGNYLCNVIIDEAQLKDANGNHIVIETSANTIMNGVSGKESATKTLALIGNVKLAQDQKEGVYSGSYKMIIAYN